MKNLRYNVNVHKGVIVERFGLGWRVWADYVTDRHNQPLVDNLRAATDIINARVA